MTPILSRRMMHYVTLIPSTFDSDATLCHWGSCRCRARESGGGGEGRSLPKRSFLASLFGHSAPELTSWAQRFLTQWCQSRACDARLAQMNSIAPAGNMQTQTDLSNPFGNPYVWERRDSQWHICLMSFHQRHMVSIENCWNNVATAVEFTYRFWNHTLSLVLFWMIHITSTTLKRSSINTWKQA